MGNNITKELLKITFKEIVSHNSYYQLASSYAKSYVIYFYILLGFISYLDSPNLGLRWWSIILLGPIVFVVCLAPSMLAFKIWLNTKGVCNPLKPLGKFINQAIDILGYVLMWYGIKIIIHYLGK